VAKDISAARQAAKGGTRALAPVDNPPSAPGVQPPGAASLAAVGWEAAKSDEQEDIVEPFGEIWIIPKTAMAAMRTVLKLKGGKIG
jgi:hypothetical protein